ncbi:MAG: site-specific DNA-methyltransferase [Xanthomonadales bacterium]|nr:site-specific DNA-methyltransferase [Xanthomonadales bacterium]
MPTLNWIGKEKVISHHQDVPYRVLQHQYGFTADNGEQSEPTNSGNKIIHGDNLEALKSLLPEYEGKIKCIYIDPPYNTGNESWVYNDNVNHPKIKKWLGEVVGKEGDDLSRHDKWLCMMYPRLKLLHKLLADDGAIFISIDDNEQANLKLLCDEIFGVRNFLVNMIWQHSIQPKGYLDKFSIHHNHTLIYQKSDCFELKLFDRTKEDNKAYKNPDNDPNGLWRSGDVRNALYRPNLIYDLNTPSGKIISPPEKGWRWSQTTIQEKISSGEIVFNNDETSITRKIYLKDQTGRPPKSIWFANKFGSSRTANKVIKEIFGKNEFETPKPIELLQGILKISTNKNSIILDSFAGSGTTAHAVLNLNKQDGGNRKFILIEMEDYANDITAERVKRVAKGYGEDKKAVEGTGGAFDFYQLGLPLFDENQNLNEEVGLSKIREYIWFSETRTPLSDVISSEVKKSPYFLGTKDQTAYYFIYEKDQLTTLDYDSLGLIQTKAEQYIIYADNCLLPKDFMNKHNIIFKKIPRDITRF